jgi:hypothetical protein
MPNNTLSPNITLPGKSERGGGGRGVARHDLQVAKASARPSGRITFAHYYLRRGQPPEPAQSAVVYLGPSKSTRAPTLSKAYLCEVVADFHHRVVSLRRSKRRDYVAS